jgi:GGDEF domain-containing protein
MCGVSREPQPEELADQLPVVELCARLLGLLWSSEPAAGTDLLTGLPNRRAWEKALEREGTRCLRFGLQAACSPWNSTTSAVNDLHGHPAGDEYLRRTARRRRA